MALKKKEFSLDAIKSKFSTKTKYKPESFYNCGEAFMGSCGLPGPVMGGINMFLGHSNTSKTTAMILAGLMHKRKVIYLFLLLLRKNGLGNTQLN